MRTSGSPVEVVPQPVHERVVSRLRRVTIRLAVWAGFIVVLALWAVAGLTVVSDIGRLEEQAARAFGRHASREDSLSRIRESILLGNIAIRDTVFDSNPITIDLYRQQIAQARQDTADAISAYVALGEPGDDSTRLGDLGSEITEYWAQIEALASEQPSRSAAEARLLLRRGVLPKRQQIIELVTQVNALDRAAFEIERIRQDQLYRAVTRRSFLISGVAILIGMGVAAVISRHTGYLERQIRAQMAKDAETTAALHRLSASLVRAQEDERRTIARELHDEIGQALTAVKVALVRARRDAGDDTPAAVAVDEARAIADRTMQTVRDLSQLLHPSMLDDLGLVSAIEWYLREFSRRTGLRTDLLHDGFTGRLPGDIEVAAYRIVQEGLTNAARHAQAGRIRVFLHRLPGSVVVTVEDDGVGFEVPALAARHERRGLGLQGIEERVTGFGGQLRIESAPGHGTRLTAEMPVGESRDSTPPDASAVV